MVFVSPGLETEDSEDCGGDGGVWWSGFCVCAFDIGGFHGGLCSLIFDEVLVKVVAGFV